jgi:predicted DNA-binding transcriptional regulator
MFSRFGANSITLLIMNSLMTQGDLKQEALLQGWLGLVLMGLAPSKA